ncbi:hypothetical protein TIFTF001_056005 [Ficus carica]|uniref:Uncharacterized protein n=1 Tax=Ficus carica TaxID=3494 RepID=A0AA88JFB6_FICCA|nr:hypothetical protein TIFTF001_056005 [Ficus carica]
MSRVPLVVTGRLSVEVGLAMTHLGKRVLHLYRKSGPLYTALYLKQCTVIRRNRYNDHGSKSRAFRNTSVLLDLSLSSLCFTFAKKFPLSFFLILYASGEQTLPLPWREDSPVPSISSQGSSWIEESYGYQGEASSSVPNPVQPYGDQGNMAEIPNPVQPHAAQDIQQDNLWNELDQPLIDEAERRNQLSTKLANRYSFGERTNRDLLRFERELQTHVEFEIEVERQLRLEGYTPATINRTREQIRDLIFYKTDNSPKSNSTLDRYLREMNGDFHSSAPWKILKNARNNNRLNLYKPGD